MTWFFWNNENSGIGGCLSTSMNNMPIVESFFFIISKWKPKVWKFQLLEDYRISDNISVRITANSITLSYDK